MKNKILTERIHYYAPAINIVIAAEIGGNPGIEEMKAAIRKALDRHEIFRSRVVLKEDGEGYYDVLPEGIARIELRESYEPEDWKQVIYEQERIAFDFVHGELIRFFLLRKAEGMQLVIIAHHLAGDGLAITYLLRDIMAALGDPEHVFEHLPIRLCTEEDFPKGTALKLHIRMLVKLGNRRWRQQKKVFSYEEYLQMFQSYWKNRRTAVVDRMITSEVLDHIREACHRHNITMNTAIATAFLLAIKNEKESAYAVSVRPEGYEGMGNFASGISMEYTPVLTQSFWENAGAIQTELYKKLNNRKKRYFVLEFMSRIEPTIMDAIYFHVYGGYRNKLAESYSGMFRYNGNPRGIGITNLTKLTIPKTYGIYSIDSLRFVAPIVSNARRIIGVATLGDCMAVTMNYEVSGDTARYAEEFNTAVELLCSLE
jgi:hypothetical protein